MEETRPYLGARKGPREGFAACAYNRALIAPNGANVTVWREETIRAFSPFDYRYTVDDFRIIPLFSKDFRPVSNGPGQEHWSTGNGRASPISYSKDGRFLWLIQYHHLAKVDVDRNILVFQEYLGWDPSRLRLTGLRHGQPTALLDAVSRARIGGMLDDARFDTIFASIDGDTINLAVILKDDEEARALLEGGLRGTGIAAGQIRKAYVIHDRGRPSLLTLGYSHGQYGAAFLSQPVVDLESGKPVGAFTPFQVRLDGERGADLVTQMKRVTNGPVFIRDVTVSGQSVAALTSDFRDRIWIAGTVGGQFRATLLCDPGADRFAKAPTELPEEPVVDKQVSIEPLDKASNSAAVAMLVHGERRSDELLVYFHGGPGVSAVDDSFYFFPRLIQDSGADVAMVEYAASTTGDDRLLNAIREMGPGALDLEAKALARFIERSGYKKVHLLGASFGALPVYAALQAKLPNVCSVTLAVPFLKEETLRSVNGKPLDDDILYWRERYFRSFIGGPARVAQLRDWIEGNKHAITGTNAAIFFAANDPLSKAENLPDRYSDKLVHMSKRDHWSIFRDPELQSHIKNVLNDESGCPARAQ